MLPNQIDPSLHRGSSRHAHRLLGVALLAILIAMPAGTALGQDGELEPVRAFVTATREYARMHRRLEQNIGTIDLNTPIESINRIVNELADAIRAERSGARQGDVFTPALRPILRARIADGLRTYGLSADDVRTAGTVEGIDYTSIGLGVNDTFPWVLAVPMFSCIADALPPLPPELQYRMVGDDLFLLDVHASLVVDILSGALADHTMHARLEPGVGR